jgi:hypothetical protein
VAIPAVDMVIYSYLFPGSALCCKHPLTLCCYQVNGEYLLVDGGFSTWIQQLLSNQKERFLISGLGSERVCSVFGKEAS